MRKIIIDYAGRSYKNAQHRKLYEDLAQKFNVTPNLVYLIAHGKKAHNIIEQKIIRELFYANVFERVGFGF